MALLFCAFAPRTLVDRCQRFGETLCLLLQAEVAMLGSGGVDVGLEGGRTGLVSDSGMLHDCPQPSLPVTFL
jgi:hypothetical protein